VIAPFRRFAAWAGTWTPAGPTCFALPDPSSLAVLPWPAQRGLVATDLQVEGSRGQSPPGVLRRQLEAGGAVGLQLPHRGWRRSFFLLQAGG